MANNQSVTNPNQIRAANWQKAAKEILNDDRNFFETAIVLEPGNYNIWNYMGRHVTEDLHFSAIEPQIPLDIQALFCLFIAEFILTDGDIGHGN